MSDPAPTENEVAPEGELEPLLFPQDRDWFLSNLLHLVNTTALRYDITVFVNGEHISGQIISGKEYLELLEEQFLGATSNSDEMKGIFTGFNFLYTPEALQKSIFPGYIHLKNFSVRRGNNKLDYGGILWRGRLQAISGFHLGSERT